MLAESGLLEFLEQWHNAIYVTPLVLGLCLLAFQFLGAFGGGHDADGDADADADMDHDLDGDADADADADADVDHDLDGDHDHDLDGDHDGFSLGGAMKFLGAGRVPFLAVLQSVLLSVGFAGLVTTYALGRTGTVAPGVPMLAWSLPIALVCGLAFSRVLTAFLGRFASTFESKGRRMVSLEGEIAVVESVVVDATQGRGLFRDPAGPEMTVFLRTTPGAAPISKGARVRLDSFVAKDNLFIVSALPPESKDGAAPIQPPPKKEATP